MNDIIVRKNMLPMKYKKPGLVDHEFIDKYVEAYGYPKCGCCHNRRELFVLGANRKGYGLFCINCALTISMCGVCQH